MAERLTARSGDFWFFEPANIELVVKVLDGCAINGHYWVFAVGLTDVAVTMTVRDLRTGSRYAGVPTSGVERSWTSPGGEPFGPINDVAAFATCAGAAGRHVISGAPRGLFDQAVESAPGIDPGLSSVSAATANCREDDVSLCLQDGRYEVRANWRAGEESGAAAASVRTSDTGDVLVLLAGQRRTRGQGPRRLRGQRAPVGPCGRPDRCGVELSVRDTSSDAAAKMYLSSEGAPFATKFELTAFPCAAGP